MLYSPDTNTAIKRGPAGTNTTLHAPRSTTSHKCLKSRGFSIAWIDTLPYNTYDKDDVEESRHNLDQKRGLQSRATL